MDYVRTTDYPEYTIATEKGVYDRLKRDYPDKTFYLLSDALVCKNMKWNSLDDIYNALLREEHEIVLDKDIADNAIKCIDRMFELTKQIMP